MGNTKEFSYTAVDGKLGEAALMPFLPIQLLNNTNMSENIGLLDTGASVNVLPFSVGKELGLKWEEQNISLKLTGNLSNHEARAVLIQAQISNFPKVRLAFAWSQSENIPLILGQTNFFMEFDVCFFRSELHFEIKPKKPNQST